MNTTNYAEHIANIIAKSSVEDGISRLVSSTIFIYGAGNYGQIIYRLLMQSSFPHEAMVGFLDANPDGRILSGYPVRHPENPAISTQVRKQAVVIISIYSSLEEHGKIAEQLHACGYKNVRSCYEIAISFYTANDATSRIFGSGYLQANIENIVSGSSLWEDKLSLDTFQNHFFGYALCDIKKFLLETSHCQYFPPTPLRGKGVNRFIDCGAFDGDTIRSLVTQFGQVDALALFEPCESNFNKLTQFVRENSCRLAEKIFLYPCGVWDSTKQLRFNSDAESASAVSATGDEYIQCVALDDVLYGFCPTFIKMDIEGAELSALHGAKSIIQENRPDLAISVYHALSHFWEIPQLVRQWVPEYRFYLRTYGAAGFETVMYAVCTEK